MGIVNCLDTRFVEYIMMCLNIVLNLLNSTVYVFPVYGDSLVQFRYRAYFYIMFSVTDGIGKHPYCICLLCVF